MKRGVLIIFVAILIPCLLQAQTTPNDPQRLTLEQAVNFAVEHNKELQASQMNIELRNKMVTEAISQGLPQINGDLNYSTNFRYKMRIPGSESSTVLKDQSSVGVTVNQLLFSGEWILGIQTSKIAKLIASQQVDVTELDIKETVYNSSSQSTTVGTFMLNVSYRKYAGSRYCRADRRRSDPHHCRTVEKQPSGYATDSRRKL